MREFLRIRADLYKRAAEGLREKTYFCTAVVQGRLYPRSDNRLSTKHFSIWIPIPYT